MVTGSLRSYSGMSIVELIMCYWEDTAQKMKFKMCDGMSKAVGGKIGTQTWYVMGQIVSYSDVWLRDRYVWSHKNLSSKIIGDRI